MNKFLKKNPLISSKLNCIIQLKNEMLLFIQFENKAITTLFHI